MLQYIPTSADNKYIAICPPLCLPIGHVVCLETELCGHSTLRSQKLLGILLKKCSSYFTQNCIVLSLKNYVNIHSTSLPNTYAHARTHTHILRTNFEVYFYSKINNMHQCNKFIYFGLTLSMFRTVFLSIIRSTRLYIQQQSNRYCCLLASKQTAVSV